MYLVQFGLEALVMRDDLTYEEFLEVRKIKPHGCRKCPVVMVFEMLQGKWKNHVINEISMRENVRFGELKKKLPSITNTMLTSTLRELEAEGLVKRQQFNEIPPHVEYSLTEKSKDLIPIFYGMYVWGLKHLSGFYQK